MTRQQSADQLLDLWRLQRQLGVPANDRKFPDANEDSFERDLEVIRKCMERA